MRLLIEIAAAALLVICIATTSAAFAAGKGRSADGLSCGFSLPQNASPAARCAAISANAAASFMRARAGIS